MTKNRQRKVSSCRCGVAYAPRKKIYAIRNVLVMSGVFGVPIMAAICAAKDAKNHPYRGETDVRFCPDVPSRT
jgi:hypothetical protein